MAQLKFIHVFFTFLASILQIHTLTNNYYIESVKDTIQDGFQSTFAIAKYRGTSEYYEKPKSTIAKTLNITALYEADDEFSVLITRGEAPPRFRMEHKFPYSFTKRQPDELNDPEYNININKDPFTINVVRTTTKETIFNTSTFDLIYSEFYITFGTTLPSEYLYGLGERRAKHFLYRTGTYTVWAKDHYIAIDNGVTGQQTYGAHPVYLMREASGNWHVVFLRTSNALDFIYNSSDRSLQYKITGGEIQLKFFLGNEYPETAIRLYHNYINKWTIMPFWSFGFHQSKWGALYIQDLIDVVNNMTQARLPLDAVWSDIDYMEGFIDFTVDPDRYNLEDFRRLVERVHWVPIIDAGISLNPSTLAYQAGTAYEIWIRSAKNYSNYLIGGAWPGLVHWPDWLNPNASTYWSEMLNLLHSLVPFSGVWLDMNENANFCSGEYPTKCAWEQNYLPIKESPPLKITNQSEVNVTVSTNKDLHNKISPQFNSTNPSEVNIPLSTDPYINGIELSSTDLPYVPGRIGIEDRALSLDALHYGNVLEFDFHNLNPLYQAMFTYQWQLNSTGKRPFVITRGNFVGTGQFAAHWTGDNKATWEYYRLSIPQLFALQLYGIPMVGADICGFAEDTTEELCARWMQLGAFYPFMRNHNQISRIPQEPYAMGPTVEETSRVALFFRYSILKFYYSIMIRNNGTGTIFRPVFYDFPFNKRLFDLQTQFLIGSELMVAVPDNEGMTKVDVYFPQGVRWYDMFSGRIMIDITDHSKKITVASPLNATLPVFIRGGSIVHIQDVSNVSKTDDLDTTFNLVVALTPISADSSVAFGQIMGIENYLDDESVDKCTGVNDCMIKIAVYATVDNRERVTVSVTFDPNREDSVVEEVYIKKITFYGMRKNSCGPLHSYCNWNDYVMACVNSQPMQVGFKTWTYVVDDGSCVIQN